MRSTSTRSAARSRSRRDRSRGQSLVEFAVVAPLLFLMVFGSFEFARFIFFYELLNNAAREGARYAIVHGSRSDCPSGPPPPGETNPCDPAGDNVKAAVRGAALDLAGTGELFVFDPVWTSRGSLAHPQPGDSSTGHSGRGEYVTVFVDFSYAPVLKQILDVPVVPSITIRAESTLVVNN
jgi:hypothetical protein